MNRNIRSPIVGVAMLVIALVLFHAITVAAPRAPVTVGLGNPPNPATVAPHPLLSDIRIRRALAYCTDRIALIGSVYPFLTTAQRQELLMNTFLPPDHWAYHAPPPEYTYPFDPARGRQLLEEAGWNLTSGATYRTNAAGDELALTLTTTNAQFRQIWAAALEAQWRDHCGIRLVREHTTASIWFGSASGLSRRDFELGAFAWVGQTDPGGRTLYACDQIPTAANGWIGQNYMGWCNPTASAAIIAANSTLLRHERINHYAIVQTEFARDMVSLPLFSRLASLAWSRHVTGITASATGYTLAGAAQWERDDGGDAIVVGFTQQPDTLFERVSSQWVAREAALLAKGAYYTEYDYDYQPVLQDGLSTIEAGLAQNATVTVTAGDRVVNSLGEAVTLAAGERVIDANGNYVTYSGAGPLAMKQLTVRYRLRNYRWSDGVAGSLADIQLGVRAECAMAASWQRSYICNAIHQTTFGPGLEYTVTYLPGYQNPAYHLLPFGIYPAHQVLSDGRVLADVPAREWPALPEIAERPLSFGPYMLAEWVRGDHMTFVANPYHTPAPKTPRLVIRFLPSSDAALDALLNGEIDVLPWFTYFPDQRLADAAAAGQINAAWPPSPTWEHIDMNLDRYTGVVARPVPPTGGVIATDLNTAITVPAGAVTTTTTFVYNHNAIPAQPFTGAATAVSGFSLQAFTASGQPVTQFVAPITIQIDYTDEELAARSIPEDSLNVAYWDGSAWRNLLPCAGCSHDLVANRITVMLDHLTEFALTGVVERARLYLPLLHR
ncbi:ABC transporter substrate-binding protein [Chloroflexus sp.]|uniref:ABC transporter substrate-binding protein n=1 Tax=Chloroflexus sp. TaxID=1904827 RepID=UPI00298F3290|nr:ABC transporter substrate-binding protein [Chloroflexus sp.]MCS6888832.1 ABC transporter substrate-binding protein [Chloroflexus sp.]MDW8405578.1 ABC transporter substrate-binding protein [Chloroflexus sp.]